MDSTQIKTVELTPILDSSLDYEEIERRINRLFKQFIYWPLVKEIGEPGKTLTNARAQRLVDALKSGRIKFYRGSFTGRFSSSISREVKALGAQWDRKTRTWKLPQSSLTMDVRNAIAASESHFRAKLEKIDQKLSKIFPEEIADKLKISDHFDSTLWKTDRKINSTLQRVTVLPQLSKSQREHIARDWQDSLKLPIKDWTEKEVAKLRKDIQASIYAGNRHDALIKIIQKSHQSSLKKAKFLASQETRLLLTKFKEVRYRAAGSEEYEWGISNNPIAPSNNARWIKGQVRHDHGILAGKKFRWDNPPITNQLTGARNNPGQDYNCRCFARPIVKFKGS